VDTTNSSDSAVAVPVDTTQPSPSIDVALIGGIVGGVVAFLLLIGIIAIIVVAMKRKRRQDGATPPTRTHIYGSVMHSIDNDSMYGDVSEVRKSSIIYTDAPVLAS
jgi:hypothetical protein